MLAKMYIFQYISIKIGSSLSELPDLAEMLIVKN